MRRWVNEREGRGGGWVGKGGWRERGSGREGVRRGDREEGGGGERQRGRGPVKGRWESEKGG